MVMKPQPFFEAVESLNTRPPIVLLSPRGRVFAHADAERFAAGEELTLLCGHYKDIDQRVGDHLATEEVSLGDFVLSGGGGGGPPPLFCNPRARPPARVALHPPPPRSLFCA